MPTPGRLIIVGGASGAGKSYLLASVVDRDPSIEIVVKTTTRGPRDYEYKTPPRDLQLSCLPGAVRDGSDFLYAYKKDLYGIRRADIDSVLGQQRHAILIVRDGRTIERMREHYPNALVLWVQSALSGKDLARKLKELKLRDLAHEDRTERVQMDFEQYVRFIDLYAAVLINYYDDTLFEQLNIVLYGRPSSSDNLVAPESASDGTKRST